jgi:hypothetical protein
MPYMPICESEWSFPLDRGFLVTLGSRILRGGAFSFGLGRRPQRPNSEYPNRRPLPTRFSGQAAALTFRSTVMPHSSSNHPCRELQLSDPHFKFSRQSEQRRNGTPPIGVPAFSSRDVESNQYRHRPRSYAALLECAAEPSSSLWAV